MAQATFYDGLTGKTIYREETATELADREKLQKSSKEQAEAAEAQAVVKASALAKLGLTEAEILALFGN